MNPASKQTSSTDESARPVVGIARSGCFILPNDHVPISESAQVIFSEIAKTKRLFVRGRTIVELIKDEDGCALDVVRPEAFRSRLERYGRPLMAWKVDLSGSLVLKRKCCAEQTAKALLATREAATMLPAISLIASAPILYKTGTVLRTGYHSELGGVLVTGGSIPPDVPVKEAVEALSDLLSEFAFQSEGDRARAQAALITPALKMGGFIPDAIPLDIAEADASQSGKTYRQKVVRAVYGERGYPIALKNGGVGSFDESLSAALISGRPFISIDNVRGRLDSQFLEMTVTWGERTAARVPHKGEIMVDPSGVTFQLTSNGVETTRDLANRSAIVRIKKRPGHIFRDYPEGKLLEHVQARQSYYLGCVFAIIRAWLQDGCKRTSETRHDFKYWAGCLDWICQNILGTEPLLDGHVEAQERASNTSLTWLRKLALALKAAGKTGVELTASDIYEFCEEEPLEVPGARPGDLTHGCKVIGALLAKCFRETAELTVDNLRVVRSEKAERDPERRETRSVKRYSVHELAVPTAQCAHRAHNLQENTRIFQEVMSPVGGVGGREDEALQRQEVTS
jgi:hypothetical protein